MVVLKHLELTKEILQEPPFPLSPEAREDYLNDWIIAFRGYSEERVVLCFRLFRQNKKDYDKISISNVFSFMDKASRPISERKRMERLALPPKEEEYVNLDFIKVFEEFKNTLLLP